MLVSRSFIAIDGDSLMRNDLIATLKFFTDRLHHELLEILAHQLKPVAIRNDDHVFLPLPVTRLVPHQSE